MNKNLVIAVLLIILAAGVYYWFGHRQASSATQPEQYITTTQSNTPAETSPATAGKHAVKWQFDAVGEDKATGAQKTKVTVTWDGVSHDAGTYQGSCAEIDGSNGTLSEGEVSGSLCWFAGAGDEIGVFNENGGFVLKHGEQQEPSGEGEGFRGNFKTLITL